MKRYLALSGMTLAVCALAMAQEQPTGERVVVPARNTSHPRSVDARVTHGSIKVKSYNGKEVIVETRGSRPSRGDTERTVDGLKRIDLPTGGLSVEEEDNVIQVRAGSMREANLVISVPPDTSLHLGTTHGDITVEGVKGEVDAGSTHGQIQLLNINGTIVASNTNGNIKATMDRVDPAKPISFSTTNGDVDVTLPADVKANVKMRSLRGSIYSDFEMKLTGGQPQTTAGGGDGKFRVQFDRTMYGTINGGGVEASFNTLNGKILIRKK
jgi:putative adhesin